MKTFKLNFFSDITLLYLSAQISSKDLKITYTDPINLKMLESFFKTINQKYLIQY